MKGYGGLFYLLFVLLIMGGFAAMAQNHYGLYILGTAGTIFGILFFYQCWRLLTNKDHRKRIFAIEPACLGILSILITLRVFYIHFNLLELILVISVTILVIFYGWRMLGMFKQYRPLDTFFAVSVPVFYLAIILYLLSILSIAVWPTVSLVIATIAFCLLVFILLAAFFRGTVIIQGENRSFFSIVGAFKDNSVIVIGLFCLFTVYAGLTRGEILPRIYSDEYPQAYFKLVDRTESGKASRADSTSDFRIYKDRYENFVKRNIGKKDQ